MGGKKLMKAMEREVSYTGADQISGFSAGAAAVCITPPEGIPMAGYYSLRLSKGVIDDLYAKAFVLDDGQSLVAFVACDLIGIPSEVIAEAKRWISQKTPILPHSVLISATHTHTGPILQYGSRRKEPDGGGSEIAQRYTRSLPEKIAQAVAEAFEKRRPAKLFVGSYEEHEVSFNRRFWMRDGSVGWNPGKLNPNIIRPVGPIDPELLVLYAESAEGESLAAYINFALHCDTVGGNLISADYPGVLAKHLREYKGQHFVTLFGNGACGDINHIDVNWADPQRGPEEANRIGTVLAGDVMKAFMKLEPVRPQPLQVLREEVLLPLFKITEDDIRRAEEILAQEEKAKFLDRVFAYKVLDIAEREGNPLEAEVQAIALGDQVAWIALPGEIFVALGLSIKHGSPYPYTFVVELANGSLGYLPHRSAYAEGEYEVISTRCAEGSGELLVTAALRSLAELYGANRATQ